MIIPWKDEYSLGIASIDTQHKKLIGTINTLGDTLLTGSKKSDIDTAIAQMETYMKEHFFFEEEYFKTLQYDGTAEHITEHQVFLDKTKDFRTRALDEEDAMLSIEILGYLEEWFLHHVLVVDRQYVSDFQAHGIN
ncbi:MAG: bacteriohemerythrin [Candidatus Moranbacteria bacterium]|nr:bacteriohemerythrin [Candidatus Moranbacteria bacterium]OIQ04477.1 MAG: hypothetical protein AUK58_00330 [Candidatus Moranbacteria bacterium CG2_30_41_165]PIP25321.1 MAG: hypothetical protein COX32_04150 [Candidatus Moranbacteria bacterium CG23_combo_of_CG06-09_8_20_14_all_41_28]PIV86361.1 MAG: hypothetical protein COW50_01935 [Candidatus Moranbacteria bacterium CG17_big_fil_post_rev_8_21_14_2_50_41_107]PIW94359.1 MAG: hypothetical protein COZ86_01530 [Candidatus Moranbacteria bacterium CG_4